MAAEHTSCTIPDLKAGVFTLKKILNKYNISEIWSFVPFLTGNHGCDHFLFYLTLKKTSLILTVGWSWACT